MVGEVVLLGNSASGGEGDHVATEVLAARVVPDGAISFKLGSYASYAEERLLGLAAFTGMNRKLLDNLMKKGMGVPKPASGS